MGKLLKFATIIGGILFSIPASPMEQAFLAPPPVSAARIMLLGYSVPNILSYTTGAKSFQDTLVASAISPTVNSVAITNDAPGGSWVCQENGAGLTFTGTTASGNATVSSISSTLGILPGMAVTPSASIPNNTSVLSVGANSITLSQNATGTGSSTIIVGSSSYWVRYNGGSPVAGPDLTAALAEISLTLVTRDIQPVAVPPTAFIWSGGGKDAEFYNLLGSQVATRFTTCLKYVFDQVESALGGSGPVPIYVEAVGRFVGFDSSVTGGFDPIRKETLTNIIPYTNVVRLPEYYDLGLFSNGHPDLNFQGTWGSRLALLIAKNQYGASPAQSLGPSIASCTSSGSTISVTITPESGVITQPSGPLGPWGFAFYDGSTLLNARFLTWSGNVAQWNAGVSSVSSLHCNYINDWGPGFDPTRVIKGSTGLPLLMRDF